MSTRAAPSAWLPGLGWWLMLAAVLTVALLGRWGIALGLLVFLMAQVVRPFDFLTAFLLVVAGATFVEYTAGGLAYQLGILTCLILLMLALYALANPERALSVSWSPLSLPLLCFLGLSLANTVRGVLVGYAPRHIGLEAMALLALGTAVLVANMFDRVRHLYWAVAGLVAIGYVAAFRGFQLFAVNRTHGEGYTMATPGIVGVLLVNLALRSKSGAATIGLVLLSLPMFLQQFITYGRGLWSGCFAALITSFLVYARFGRGSGPRWKRTGMLLGAFLGLGLAGAIVTAQAFDQADLLREASSRVQSSFDTGVSYGGSSNLIRLGEYLFVWELIQQSPWIGHGVGFAFTMKQVISRDVGEQWYAHQYFLFVWLKQGLIGLGLFLWMLVSAIRLGVHECGRRENTLESTWFATSASATVFLATLSLSNFPFGLVNEMFLLALLWGGSMAMARSGMVSFRWTAPAQGVEGGD